MTVPTNVAAGTTPVAAGATVVSVTGTLDTAYSVSLSASWVTSFQVSAKTGSQFTVTFGTPAPVGGGTLDWIAFLSGVRTNSNTQSLQNIRQSVNKALQTSLATYGDGVNFPGALFDDAGRAEWLRVDLLGPARPEEQFYRQVSSTLRGQGVLFLLRIACFVRPRLQNLVYRLEQIRDDVVGVLTEHSTIAVLDYAAGTQASLGNLVVRRLTLDNEVTNAALGDEIRQWALGWDLRWIETY